MVTQISRTALSLRQDDRGLRSRLSASVGLSYATRRTTPGKIKPGSENSCRSMSEDCDGQEEGQDEGPRVEGVPGSSGTFGSRRESALVAHRSAVDDVLDVGRPSLRRACTERWAAGAMTFCRQLYG